MSHNPKIALLRHHLRLVRPLLLGALFFGVVAYWPLAAITLNANRSGGFLSNLLSGYSDADVRMLMVPAVLVMIWAMLALALSIRLFISPTANSPATFLLERPITSKLLWWTRFAAVVVSLTVVAAVHLVFWRVALFLDSPHDGGVQTLIAASVVIPVCICIGIYAASICIDRSRAALVAIGILAVGTAATMIAVEIAPLATLGSVPIVLPLGGLIAFTLLRAAFIVSVQREPLGPPRLFPASRSVGLVTVFVVLAFLPLAHGVVKLAWTPDSISFAPLSDSSMFVELTSSRSNNTLVMGPPKFNATSLSLIDLASGEPYRQHLGPLDGLAVDRAKERYLLWRRFDRLGRRLSATMIEIFSVADGRLKIRRLEADEKPIYIGFRGEQLFLYTNVRCEFVPVSEGIAKPVEGCDLLRSKTPYSLIFESESPLKFGREGGYYLIENESTKPVLRWVDQKAEESTYGARGQHPMFVESSFPWNQSIHDQLVNTPIPAGPNIETSFAIPSPSGRRLWMFDSNVDGLPEVDPFWMNDQEVGGTGPFLKGPWRMWVVDLDANSAIEIDQVSAEWETLHLRSRQAGYLIDISLPEIRTPCGHFGPRHSTS